MSRQSLLKKLQNKFDRQALDQLRAEIERLGHEVDRLRQDVNHANELVDFWHERAIGAMHFNEDQQHSVGLTQDGYLVDLDCEQRH